MVEPSPTPGELPTLKELIRGCLILTAIGIIGVHILCFLWHYVPWLDDKISKRFGEPPKKEVVYLPMTPTPTPSPTATAVTTPH